MPHGAFFSLVNKARYLNWFPNPEKCNALGQIGIPLELLLLGCLRYIGRGWTFDNLYETTFVSIDVFRSFFKHKFIVIGATILYPLYVTEPTTDDEIKACMYEFSKAGFDGAIGSADATHIVWDRCPFKFKNLSSGGKENGTAKAFEITVNHRR